MPSFAPATLAHWTTGHWTVTPACALTGFTQDTRTLRPGDQGKIFIALRTPARDGHDYLPAARDAGAAAAIVSTPNHALSPALPQLVVPDPLLAFQKIATAHRAAFQAAGGIVIGISGSAGKTSTKELLALILSEAHTPARVLATEGNLNNHIGVPLTLTRLDPTIHKYAVIEAGISAPGEMLPLAEMITPDHAIITTIAPAHTQNFPDGLAQIAAEKAILLQHVRNNGARLFPATLRAYPSFANLAGASANAPATGSAGILPAGLDSALKLFNLPTLFPSHGMAQNTALAITLAKRLHITNAQIQSALAAWRPAKWRGELRHDASGRLFYLDFYNANPASMRDALDTFARLAPPEHPRLYVLGCMEELGADSPRYHRELGQTLFSHLRPQDHALFIGDRAEDIAAGAAERSEASAPITIATTPAEIAARIAAFKQGAIFLKGSRRYALEKTLPPDLLVAQTAKSARRAAGAPNCKP